MKVTKNFSNLKFTGVEGSIRIMSATFGLILLVLAIHASGLVVFPVQITIEAIIVLAATMIVGLETYAEKTYQFEWNLPTIFATIAIIGNFILVTTMALGIPEGFNPLIDLFIGNRFILYLALAIFAFAELFKIKVSK